MIYHKIANEMKKIRRLNFAKLQVESNIIQQIHSEHLLPEDVAGCQVFADRLESIKSLQKGLMIAEIGVLFGDFTSNFLSQCKPRNIDCYDIFNSHDFPQIWGKSTSEIFKGKSHKEWFENKFSDEIQNKVMNIYEGDSSTELAKKPNGYYGVIYLDGDHNYEGIFKDSNVAISKIKEKGYLIFNDYIMFDHIAMYKYGVVQVVNDLVRNHGWKFHWIALQNEMFMDVCLVKKDK
jgi:hypothetical protein